MYKVGDVFIINDKEYKLRIINNNGGCWLEPVIIRSKSFIVTAGRNFLCGIKDLDQYEFVDE